MLNELRLRQVPSGARIPIASEAPNPVEPRPGAITLCGRIVAEYARLSCGRFSLNRAYVEFTAGNQVPHAQTHCPSPNRGIAKP